MVLENRCEGKQGNKQLALTLVSAYHPCTKTGDDATYLRFLNTLDTLLNQAPQKLEIIMSADINSNIGTLDDLLLSPRTKATHDLN